jgi:hypothetical protein
MSETIKNLNVFPKVVNSVSYGEKFVDFDGLDYFWGKAKKYVDDADALLSGRIDTEKGRIDDLAAIVGELTGTGSEGSSIADRIQTAINNLDLPNTYAGKAATEQAISDAKEAAIESAKGYTDGQVSGMASTLRGEMAEDLAEAKKYTDDEIVEAVGSFTAEGVTASGLRKEIEDRDAQVLADAKGYADGLNEAMDARMQAVEAGVDSVEDKITAAFNDFSTKVSDDKVVNTYKELIDYAAEHGAEFTELVGVVNGKADKTYVDDQDSALAGRIKALEDVKDAYVEADNTLATTLRGEIATAKSGAETVAAAYTDAEVKKVSDVVDALSGTVANNHAAAMQEAADKAAAAEAAAKADTDEKLKSYTNTTAMEAAIAAAKEAAIADAKVKVDALAETVALKADKSYVDDQDAAMLAAAKTYASTYTDQLFNSIAFVTEGDIDAIFTDKE